MNTLEIVKIYFEMLDELPTVRRKKNLLLRCKKELDERLVDLSECDYLHGDKVTPKMVRETQVELNYVNSLLVTF